MGRLAAVQAPFWAVLGLRCFYNFSKETAVGFSERIPIPRIVKETGVQANRSRLIQHAGIHFDDQVFITFSEVFL